MKFKQFERLFLIGRLIQPPSERLMAAVDLFYSLPSHDRPRDPEGWEKLGTFKSYSFLPIRQITDSWQIVGGIFWDVAFSFQAVLILFLLQVFMNGVEKSRLQ